MDDTHQPNSGDYGPSKFSIEPADLSPDVTLLLNNVKPLTGYLIVRLGASPDEADDCVQQMLLSIIKKPAKIRHRSYLFKMAFNTFNHVLRRKYLLNEALDEFFEDSATNDPFGCDREFRRRQQATRLSEAVDQLEPVQRDVVRRRYFEGESQRDIAESYERSEGWASGVLEEARSNLRDLLSFDG